MDAIIIRNIFGLALALTVVASPAEAAPSVIAPGGERLNVALQQVILNQDTSPGSGNVAGAFVGPYHDDNTVRLLADAQYCRPADKLVGLCSVTGKHSAFARGTLIYEFCVPVVGASACGAGGAPEEITVMVSFHYAYEGQLSGGDPLAKATFDTSAQLRDFTAARTLDFRELRSESVSGQIKKIKGLPVPVPGTSGVEQTERITFQARVLRGHVIRFTAFAAIRAESGVSLASSVFTPGQVPTVDGHFAIPDLDIQVSPEGAPGGEGPTVPDLTEQIAQLAERLNGLDLGLDAGLADLNVLLTQHMETLLSAQADQIGALQAMVQLQAQQLLELRRALDAHVEQPPGLAHKPGKAR